MGGYTGADYWTYGHWTLDRIQQMPDFQVFRVQVQSPMSKYPEVWQFNDTKVRGLESFDQLQEIEVLPDIKNSGLRWAGRSAG